MKRIVKVVMLAGVVVIAGWLMLPRLKEREYLVR